MNGPLRTHCIPNVPVIFPSFHRILKQVYHREKRIPFSVLCCLYPCSLANFSLFFSFMSYIRSYIYFTFSFFSPLFTWLFPFAPYLFPLVTCLFLLSHATCVPFSLFRPFHLTLFTYFFLLATCLFHLFPVSLYS